MSDEQSLKRTPLFEQHQEAGGKIVDFAGWEMPVQYSSLIEEHRAVRGAAGLFDVSHMGEFRVVGAGAEEFLQRLTPNDVSKLSPGRAHYSGLLTEQGMYVDDLLVYKLDQDEFLLVVNAANAPKDLQWLQGHIEGNVQLSDVSDEFALLALQGPRAIDILSSLSNDDLAGIRYYRFVQGSVAGRPALISRTGYTGEDGFELYVASDDAGIIWDEILTTGSPLGLLPAGLGARDTLRLEAGMALYGHEIDDTATPLDAGLGWVVKLDKGEFIGRQALIDQAAAGLERRLIGFEITERGIARQDHEVVVDGQTIGRVTSGTWSPTFEKAIGMAYVPVEMATPGGELSILVRSRELSGTIVDLPFYKRAK